MDDVNKFNANFKRFQEDIIDIINDEGLKTAINLLNTADMLMPINHKIDWFSNFLSKEIALPPSNKIVTVRDIYLFDNMKLFTQLMLDEFVNLAKVKAPEIDYTNLEMDDRELIETYIKSFVNITEHYISEKNMIN